MPLAFLFIPRCLLVERRACLWVPLAFLLPSPCVSPLSFSSSFGTATPLFHCALILFFVLPHLLSFMRPSTLSIPPSSLVYALFLSFSWLVFLCCCLFAPTLLNCAPKLHTHLPRVPSAAAPTPLSSRSYFSSASFRSVTLTFAYGLSVSPASSSPKALGLQRLRLRTSILAAPETQTGAMALQEYDCTSPVQLYCSKSHMLRRYVSMSTYPSLPFLVGSIGSGEEML